MSSLSQSVGAKIWPNLEWKSIIAVAAKAILDKRRYIIVHERDGKIYIQVYFISKAYGQYKFSLSNPDALSSEGIKAIKKFASNAFKKAHRTAKNHERKRKREDMMGKGGL